MSWSVSAIGKPAKVAEKLKADLTAITYLTGPEADVKEHAAAAIVTAVEALQGRANR